MVQSFAEVLLMQVIDAFACADFEAFRIQLHRSSMFIQAAAAIYICCTFSPDAIILQDNVSKTQILEHLRTDSPDSFFARSQTAAGLSDISNSVTRTSSPSPVWRQGNCIAQEISGLRSPSRLYKVSEVPLQRMLPLHGNPSSHNFHSNTRCRVLRRRQTWLFRPDWHCPPRRASLLSKWPRQKPV
jgi:hypothetical protein